MNNQVFNVIDSVSNYLEKCLLPYGFLVKSNTYSPLDFGNRIVEFNNKEKSIRLWWNGKRQSLILDTNKNNRMDDEEGWENVVYIAVTKQTLGENPQYLTMITNQLIKGINSYIKNEYNNS